MMTYKLRVCESFGLTDALAKESGREMFRNLEIRFA
jgi:hypothetical protein